MVAWKRTHPGPARSRPMVLAASIALLLAAGIGIVALRRVKQPEAAPDSAPAPASGRRVAHVAGASSAGRPVSAPPPRAATEIASDAAPTLGLFARLSLRPEQERLLHEADEAQIAACMRQRGFTYVQHAYDRLAEDEAERAVTRPGDFEAARTHGYGLAKFMETPERPPPDPNAEQVARMPADAQSAWSETLLGPRVDPSEHGDVAGIRTLTLPGGSVVQWSGDSCVARARAAVYGDDVRYREMLAGLERLLGEVYERARQDPEYRAGIERWRACMTGRGFSYPEPETVPDALAQEFHEGRLDLSTLREREIDVATADAGCFGDAGLASRFDTAYGRAQAAVERRDAGVLEYYIAQQADALDRAGRLARR